MLKQIVFFDIEVANDKIVDLGAVKDKKDFHSRSINAFVDFVGDCQFVCGHNIVEHDCLYLGDNIGVQHKIDTLYWSPLLFSKKPYHRLLKDDKFDPNEANNPLNDAIKAERLFWDEVAAFDKLPTNLKSIYYMLLKDSVYFRDFFVFVDYKSDAFDIGLVGQIFADSICQSVDIESKFGKNPIELAYAISQIEVMLFDSVSITPPWVLKKFPVVENILHALKGKSCQQCVYCTSKLDVNLGLKQWFGYDKFRTYDGENLQEEVAKRAIDGKSLLAVFPTGGGKSITFQLPALMQGQNQKGLTVVVSPLQSLQKDQVDNLEGKHNITKAVRLDGSLDPIERTIYMDRVEDGGASLLYVSPESLRSRSTINLLTKRTVVRVVIDEAHCFSAWGQDFRTDYLYIAEFIKNLQEVRGNHNKIPVSCFTATAKREVVQDIVTYFKDNLDLDLDVFVAQAGRENLKYHAIKVDDQNQKDQKLRDLLQEYNCPSIVYVSRTRRATELASKLNSDGFDCVAYHGKMDRVDRVHSQEQFIKGQCNTIVATKAFGMGVDKDNVGLVVHYDISTSLEDYVQEAGRAGRDTRLNAVCYALFNDDDINKHFAFLSQTKITQQEIGQVWQALKKMIPVRREITSSRKKMIAERQEITSSRLEIARCAGWSDENESEISTRISTAINALEQVYYVKRGQNMPRVYASSLLVRTLADGAVKIRQSSNVFESDVQKENAVRVLGRLFKTRSKSTKDGEGENEQVDFIADKERLDTDSVIKIVQKLKELGVLADTKDLYGFLHRDNGNTANRVLNAYQNTENFLFQFLQENRDDILTGKTFSIKQMSEQCQKRYSNTSIAHLKKLINFYDIKKLMMKKIDFNRDYYTLKVNHSIDYIVDKGKKRLSIASWIIKTLYQKLTDTKSNDSTLDENYTKVEFSAIELMQGFNACNELSQSSMFEQQTERLFAQVEDIEDALYYLKRIGSVDIDGGFLVIYNRISIKRLELDNSAKYTKEHYKRLDKYYENKKEQIHIIAEYLNLLSSDYQAALDFTHDYFVMDYQHFKLKYFRGRFDDLKLNMTKSKYNQIFSGLSPMQSEIVNDSTSKYIATIAGPGSGKTMLLTHKLASIFLQEDIKHEQILMLTFSRAAATEFKLRLLKLIGNAANFVKIKTFHSYCFDLLGKVGSLDQSDQIVEQAIAKIKQNETDNSKLTNAILVIDEAQDMSNSEYQLVRQLMIENDGLKVVAVGDDDQNIYEWRGSSSQYLGKIAESSQSTKYELSQNFRSADNIVQFSNNFATKIQNRLKTQPLVAKNKQNGNITVCKLYTANIETPIVNQVIKDNPSGSVCVVVRTNTQANSILGLLAKNKIDASLLQTNDNFKLGDLREVRFFCDKVMQSRNVTIDIELWDDIKHDLNRKFFGSNDLEIVNRMIKDFEKLHLRAKYKTDFDQFVTESKLEDFVSTRARLFVSTIHQTKGREFDNVYLAVDAKIDKDDQEYRNLYVAITRAKNNLFVFDASGHFADIYAPNMTRLSDHTVYTPPSIVVLQLSHKDVFLSAFKSVQDKLSTIKSGWLLQPNETGLLLERTQVVKFSRSFMEKIAKWQAKGYYASKATVNHMVWWRPSDSPKEDEMLIVLPKIELVKQA